MRKTLSPYFRAFSSISSAQDMSSASSLVFDQAFEVCLEGAALSFVHEESM